MARPWSQVRRLHLPWTRRWQGRRCRRRGRAPAGTPGCRATGCPSHELHLRLAGWQVTSYCSVEAALRALVRRSDPFVLVLDHDLQDSRGRYGFDIAATLRRLHPFGLLLPILYHSGRVEQEEYADNERERQSFAPTTWVKKGDGQHPLLEMVAHLSDGYWKALEAQAEQQLRRAIGDVPDDGEMSTSASPRASEVAR